MVRFNEIKKGDYILVKCRVNGVFSHSGMLSVTTRDCNEGFDAYLDEIEDVCDPLPEDNKWPKEGDQFYYVCIDGNIQDTRYRRNGWIDKMLAIGNAFRTYDEAEFAKERLRVIQILKQYEDKAQVWDGMEAHFYIRYDLSCGKIVTSSHREFKAGGTIYFRSNNDALTAIKMAGVENVKKYYLDLGVIE